MSSLFRPEALAAQSSQLLGGIRIATPPRFAVIACVALGLVLALVAFATLGHATRKARVAGVLLPAGGLLQLGSYQPARLQAVHVREGDVVEAGQVLAVLQLGSYSDKGDTAALLNHSLLARMDALGLERRGLLAQAAQREQALLARTQSLRVDLLQAEGELDAVHSRVRMAETSLRRDEGLALQGFLSSAQVQVRREELLDLQVRERSAQRALESLKRELGGAQAEIGGTRLQARTQQAQIDRTEAALEQESTELSARSLLHLVAPQQAVVGNIAVKPGQSLRDGQTVLSLLPSGGIDGSMLQAQLYAASKASGFIEPGQDVWLRLHAFPYQKFGLLPGRVAEVSRTPVLPQDLPQGLAQSLLSAAEAQEPLYRITVDVQATALHAFGRTQPLKAGMTLDADVIQDRRAIWEWALEPLLAAKHRWQIPSIEPK